MKLFDGKALGIALAASTREFVMRQLATVSREINRVDASIDRIEQKISAALVVFSDRIAAIPAGPRGEKGDTGERGEKGFDGARGEKGDTGERGIAGAAGARGAQGDRGERGEVGPQGERGEKGDAGLVGAQGEKGDTGERGEKGERGADGESADAEALHNQLRLDLDAAVKALPVPKDGAAGPQGVQGPQGERGEKGERGETGLNGKDAEPVHPDTLARIVLEATEKALAALPKARDGINGRDGRDAAELVIRGSVELGTTYAAGTVVTAFGGLWRAERETDALMVGVGLTGKDMLMAGWRVLCNGIASETEETLDEGRTIRRVTTYTNGKQIARELKTNAMLNRGLYKEGNAYARGDIVTWSGSMWHCEAAVATLLDKPGQSTAWRLVVKHGRDGKDAPPSADKSAPFKPTKLK